MAVVLTLVYRVVLPTGLLFAAVIRPCFISSIFGVLGLISAVLPSITVSQGVRTVTKAYFIASLLITISALIAQAAFQVFQRIAVPKGDYVKLCNSTTEILFQHLGWIRVGIGGGWLNDGRIVLSDVAALVTVLVCYIICTCCKCQPAAAQESSAVAEGEQNAAASIDEQQETNVDQPMMRTDRLTSEVWRRRRETFRRNLSALLKRLSDFGALLLLIVVAGIRPSLLSLVYLFFFLVVITWWAVYKPLTRRRFNLIKAILLFYSAIHLVVLYLYQLHMFQLSVPRTGFAARLVGLTGLVEVSCPITKPWLIVFVPGTTWSAYANPVLLLAFYFYLVVQYRFTMAGVSSESRVRASSVKDDGSSVHEELLGVDGDEEVFSGAEPTTEEAPVAVQQDQSAGEPTHEMLSSAQIADRAKIQRLFSVGTSPVAHAVGVTLTNVATFLLFHCYAWALLAMMLWAILYRCWFSFIWLVLACVLWVAPKTRTVSFRVSPFIVAYAEVLLVLQFVYSMDLTEDELYPASKNTRTAMKQIGFLQPETLAMACVPFYIKTLLSLPFFVTLRLFLREKYYEKSGRGAAVAEEERKRMSYGTFVLEPAGGDEQRSTLDASHLEGGASTPSSSSWLMRFLAKYWIYVVALTLLFISVRNPVFLYTVGYMIFFGSLVVLLQASFLAFRAMLFGYWTILIGYSSAVLVVVYLYQFEGVPAWWRNLTHLSDHWNQDIGLIGYDPAELLSKLLAPISFLVVVILQLKFFHATFLRLTDLNAAEQLDTPREVQGGTTSTAEGSEQQRFWETTRLALQYAIDVAFRLAEVHAPKLVSLVLVCVAVRDVNLINFIVVVMVVLMVPLARQRGRVMAFSFVIAAFLTTIVVFKMIYQLHFAKRIAAFLLPPLERSCSPFPRLENGTDKLTPKWIGLADSSQSIFAYVRPYVLALILLAIQAIVFARQKYRRVELSLPEENAGLVPFPMITRKEADDNIPNCIKFLLNYGFYKFGLEICFTMTVIVAMVRMDAVAVFYIFLLFVLVLCSRNVLSRIWWLYVIILSILLPVQYAICVGLPPRLCLSYPWNILSNHDENINLRMWLFLPSYKMDMKPTCSHLVFDFLQYIAVVSQLFVFRIEKSGSLSAAYAGGSNKSIFNKKWVLIGVNPIADYISKKRSFLDFVKVLVFAYGHWVTLVMVLVAGLGGTSLFALGYLLAAFVFLWKGNDLYLTSINKIVHRWKMLLLYNVFAICCKVGLQIVGCVFIKSLHNVTKCWLLQLFSIICLNPKAKRIITDTATCNVSKEETRIGFDLLCFIFVVFQIRALHSWYFQWVITEYRTERVLSSRGAVLVNQLIRKEMKEQEEAQEQKFEKIRQRTLLIRQRKEARQAKGHATKEPQTYAEAKRAGDYYMFDYDPDIEDDDSGPPPVSYAPEPRPGLEEQKGLGPAQLLHTAVQKDLDLQKTVDAAEKVENLPADERAAAALAEDADEIRPQFVDEGSEAEMSKDTKEEEALGIGDRIVGVIRFVWKFVETFLDWIACFCNLRSRDYRYVAHVLGQERAKLRSCMSEELAKPSVPIRDMRKMLIEGQIGEEIRLVKCEADIQTMEEEVDKRWVEKNVLARVIMAVSFLVISHTELLCYVLVIVDHMTSGSLLSLPLPILMFFWGTLCSPRPPKLFWIVLIAYTEAIVVIKFIFQFGFFPFSSKPNDRLDIWWMPRILGIQRQNFYAFWDIVLLICLFFHRYMLRKLGLWKDALQTASLAEKVQHDEEDDDKV